MALPDYGGKQNVFTDALHSLAFYNVIVVTDGMTVSSENAKQKKIYLLHPMLTPGKHEECKQLVTRAPPLISNGKVQKKTKVVPMERPDCEHPDCTDPVATGGGGRFCRTHKPTVSQTPYTPFYSTPTHPIFTHTTTLHSTAPFHMTSGLLKDTAELQTISNLD